MKFKIKSEATDVASPRSSSRKLNSNKQIKMGEQHQREFTKMIKKIMHFVFRPRVSEYIDAKTWIQKVLLEQKYGKINS